MKIRTKLFTLLMLSTVFVFSCSDDDEEECVQDEVAACDINYTTCCTNDDCTYEYNGRTYTDEDDVIDAITSNCSTAADEILASVQASTARAKANLY